MSERARALINNVPFKKVILYTSFVSAVAGSTLLSINVGSFNLFPYRILLPILWLLLVISIIIDRRLPDTSYIKVKPYLWFIVAWFSYAIVTVLWADSKFGYARNIFLLFNGLSLIVFPVLYFTRLVDFKRFYRLWLLMLVPMEILGLLNHFFGIQLLGKRYPETALQDFGFMHTVRATFVHENDFATYLALSIPFIVAFIRHSKSWSGKVFGFVLLVPALLNLTTTYSRANMAALILGLTVWFIVLLKPMEKLKMMVPIGFIALLAILKSPDYMRMNVQLMVAKTIGLVSGNHAVEDTIRINLIKNSLIFLVQHYGFGVGAGNAEYHMQHFRVYPTEWINNVHNWWIELLVNYGVFVFVGYLIFFFSLLVNLYKTYGQLENPTEKMICEALLVGMVIFIPASMASSSIMGFGPQWIFFGFILGFLNHIRLKQARD